MFGVQLQAEAVITFLQKQFEFKNVKKILLSKMFWSFCAQDSMACIFDKQNPVEKEESHYSCS